MGVVPSVSEVTIVNLQAGMAGDLEQIELTCFPMANPDDLLSKEDIVAYAEVFLEGYFVASQMAAPSAWAPASISTSTSIALSTPLPASPVITSAPITTRMASGTTGPTSPSCPSIEAAGIGGMLYERRKGLVIRDGKRHHRRRLIARILPVQGDDADRPIREPCRCRGASRPTLTFSSRTDSRFEACWRTISRTRPTTGGPRLIVWENTSLIAGLRLIDDTRTAHGAQCWRRSTAAPDD